VRRERQPWARRLGRAVGVAGHPIACCQHELAARLQTLAIEGRGAPDGEAGRVPVPDVAGRERIADWSLSRLLADENR
jgi:hypothetical protein